MQIQDAIKSLQNIVEYWTYKPTEVETAKIAIAALEKQIPKMSIDADSYYACPVCDEEVDHLDAYCKNCGQKLYWGEFWEEDD